MFCQELGFDRERQSHFLFVANGAWVMRGRFQSKLCLVDPKNKAKIQMPA